MRWVLNKSIIMTAVVTFICYVLPVSPFARGKFVGGKATPEEAAKWSVAEDTNDVEQKPLRLAALNSHTWAQPDSSVFEFPEEENQHLVRDITIFVIASLAVGYFLVKVFLQGDTEEEEATGDNGRPDGTF